MSLQRKSCSWFVESLWTLQGDYGKLSPLLGVLHWSDRVALCEHEASAEILETSLVDLEMYKDRGKWIEAGKHTVTAN